MENSRLLRILLALTVIGCLAGVVNSRVDRPEIIIRIAFLASQDDEDYVGAVAFRDAMRASMGKRVEVQIYPSGQFCGSERECIEALQSGILEMHQTTVGGLAGLYGAAQVFDLPYLFRDDAVAECVLDGPVVTDMGKAMREAGLGLRLMVVGNTGGWRSFATTTQRIQELSDLRGLRIRTLPSAMEQEMVRDLGASPMPLPFSELYGALGAGLLAGTKNSVQDVVGMKLNDHLRYLFIDRHSYMAAIWWYSDAGWARLPPDVQAAVQQAFKALAAATRKVAQEREAPAVAEFLRRGGTIDFATAAQRDQLKIATRGLRAWYEKRYGADWLTRADAAVAQCEARHPLSVSSQLAPSQQGERG